MRQLCAMVVAAGMLATAYADTISLKDGSFVNGTFLGGDSRSVRFAVGDTVQTFSVGEIRDIRFGGDSGPAPAVRSSVSTPPPVSVAPASPPASASGGREIPRGSVLTVRMTDDVDSMRDEVGKTYRASLDEALNDAGGYPVAPRGTPLILKLVDDQESGKIEGRTVLTLDVVSLEINGQQVPIDTAEVTQQSGSRTARSGKVIGGTAALGAIIGAIAGGGKGAAIGAVSGAGAGTAVQVLTKGQRVRIPSETRLTFTLQQAVRL